MNTQLKRKFLFENAFLRYKCRTNINPQHKTRNVSCPSSRKGTILPLISTNLCGLSANTFSLDGRKNGSLVRFRIIAGAAKIDNYGGYSYALEGHITLQSIS